MYKPALALCLITVLASGAAAQDTAPAISPFPPSNALAEGVSPDALDKLNEIVRKLVEDEEVVGAELLVIKNGHSILHEAYGWRDREAEIAMETGSVFCVRSMTKPFIAASILMLVEERELKLKDEVSRYLPSCGADRIRIPDATVDQGRF